MIQKKIWHEKLYNNFGQYFLIDEDIYHQKTMYQDLLIFKNTQFGRIMSIDNIVQTTEHDEFIYHEMIVHVPCIAHGNVKNILIIGGGDGAALREIIKYNDIQSITMVEIDIEIIKMCQKYLPNHSAGAFKDKRLELIIQDGVEFVNTTNKKFDVIITDCPDPIGPGINLFTKQFYYGCKKILHKNGILVAQNGVFFLQKQAVMDNYSKLINYFSDVSFYKAAIPTYYGGEMCFIWCSDNINLRKIKKTILKQRFNSKNLICRYYNPYIHVSSFALPQELIKKTYN